MSQGSSAAIFYLRHPTRVTRDTSLPWLARISRQSPSLALTRLAWGCRGPRGKGDTPREDEGGCHPLPTTYPLLATHACARDPCTRALVRERTRTQSCGRSLLRTRGGRDNKICDNQPQRRGRRRRRRESVMTLFSDELSGDVRHVTCTCSLLLSFSPFSSPILLPPWFSQFSRSFTMSIFYLCVQFHCLRLSPPALHSRLSRSLPLRLRLPLRPYLPEALSPSRPSLFLSVLTLAVLSNLPSSSHPILFSGFLFSLL